MKVLKFVGMGILGVAAIGLFILGTMHLWNWLIPMLFHGPIVTYWQAAGLLILSKIFFSGFGHGHGHGRHHGSGHHGHCCEGERPKREGWWKHYHNCCNDKDNNVTVE